MQNRSKLTSLLGAFALAVTFFAVACGPPPTPEERVADIRSKYTVEVNQSGFSATPHEPEPDPMAEGEATEEADEAAGETEGASDEGTGGDEAAAAGEAGEGEGEMEPPDLGPQTYDILLDLIVATTSRETLDQLTVDVVHLDSSETEKNRWQVTLDTSGIHRGPGAQITHELTDIEYVDGDIFFAEVRHPVPAAEVSKYPELANAS